MRGPHDHALADLDLEGQTLNAAVTLLIRLVWALNHAAREADQDRCEGGQAQRLRHVPARRGARSTAAVR